MRSGVYFWITEADMYQADRINQPSPGRDSECGYRRTRHRRSSLRRRNQPGESGTTHFHTFLFCIISIASYPGCPVTLFGQTAWTAMTLTLISPVRWQTTTGALWQNPTGKTTAAAPVSVPSLVMRRWSPWDTVRGSSTPLGVTPETTPQQCATSWLTVDLQLGWDHL